MYALQFPIIRRLLTILFWTRSARFFSVRTFRNNAQQIKLSWLENLISCCADSCNHEQDREHLIDSCTAPLLPPLTPSSLPWRAKEQALCPEPSVAASCMPPLCLSALSELICWFTLPPLVYCYVPPPGCYSSGCWREVERRTPCKALRCKDAGEHRLRSRRADEWTMSRNPLGILDRALCAYRGS
jgi:hypothetical protein